MAHVILVHLLYLLASIDLFNLIQKGYIQEVKASLVAFMNNIKEMVYNNSIYLYELMNKLIKLFCRLINSIFLLIEAKLLYYLEVLELQIDFDWFLLSAEVASFELMLSELKSLVNKYTRILETVKGLTKALVRLTKHNKKFQELIQNLIQNNGNRNKWFYHTFSYKNHEISKILKSLSSIKLERSIKSSRDKNPELVMNLKINLGKLNKHLSYIINLISVDPLIIKVHDKTKGKMTVSITNTNGSKDNGIQNVQESIKKILDEADEEVLKEIIDLIGQLEALEIINLAKINALIIRLQVKYDIILVRGYLLLWTIQFYIEITKETSNLFGFMKFDCCNTRDFLSSCFKVENYLSNVSKSINACIEKLAGIDNKYKIKKFEKLKEVLLNLIGIILRLKFYVDLMAREILIFKMIIMNLIGMAVSSLFIDSLMFYIGSINGIDSAIKSLRECHGYLRTFYNIQIQNTLVIFALSNALKFSQSIHESYKVLLYNLDLINRLIWVIECYIIHIMINNQKCGNVGVKL